MKNKWDLARYLIDAKKAVDSMWFISDNARQLRYIDLRKKTNELRTEFYIKCCVVLDEYIASRQIKKKELCEKDSIVDRVYYERDKNSAHKDEQYQEQDYSSLEEITSEMKKQIVHVRKVASNALPKNLTLDFVSHDRELFRLVHHVTADVEDEIIKRKYPSRDMLQGNTSGKVFRILHDTEDVRKIPDNQKTDYAVVVENGICFNEGVQTRQDACIKFNVLFGENMWCEVNKTEMDKVKELTELGCFDEFGIIQPPPTDPILLARIQRILNSPMARK